MKSGFLIERFSDALEIITIKLDYIFQALVCFIYFLLLLLYSFVFIQKLFSYSYPGNVRELENILERAITLCDGNVIQEQDLRLSGGNEPLSGEFPQPNLAEQNLDSALNHTERDAILRALEQTRYNKTAAAKLLGLSFRQLRYRIKKLGIE